MFRLFAIAEQLDLKVWLNGDLVDFEQEPRQKKKGEREVAIRREQLRRGRNWLAVEVAPSAEDTKLTDDQMVLSVRLDPIPEAGQLTAQTAGDSVLAEVELVTQKAVVCDLCSSTRSQSPACVDLCPHEAAIRVDARYDFPSV